MPRLQGLFGERICSQSKAAIYNRGTVMCWLEPSKKSSWSHTAAEIFLGPASWSCPRRTPGGVGKDPLPLPVPDRLCSVSAICLQVERLEWVLATASRVRSPETGAPLAHQSPCTGHLLGPPPRREFWHRLERPDPGVGASGKPSDAHKAEPAPSRFPLAPSLPRTSPSSCLDRRSTHVLSAAPLRPTGGKGTIAGAVSN